jgi:hypothetical protein
MSLFTITVGCVGVIKMTTFEVSEVPRTDGFVEYTTTLPETLLIVVALPNDLFCHLETEVLYVSTWSLLRLLSATSPLEAMLPPDPPPELPNPIPYLLML